MTYVKVLGGALLIIGYLVALASIPLMISMLVAILTIHIHYGFSSVNTIGFTPAGPVVGPSGYEINILCIAALIALALSSPTAASVDRILLWKKMNHSANTENS